jgi:ankyrin repeat protein
MSIRRFVIACTISVGLAVGVTSVSGWRAPGSQPASGDADLARGRHGFQAMSTAARVSDIAGMTRLLAAGADPNVPDAGGNRWVPLMHAVHKRQTEAVRWLLDHGARADGPAGSSFTPLMMAVGSGQAEATRLLLARGADPRRRTPSGGNLLTLAVSGGAMTDIDEPLLGGCHPETVRIIRAAAPDLRVDANWLGRMARLFAWLNGCRA